MPYVQWDNYKSCKEFHAGARTPEIRTTGHYHLKYNHDILDISSCPKGVWIREVPLEKSLHL